VLANCDLDLTTIIAISTNLQENGVITTLVLDRPLLSSRKDENCDHMSRVLGCHRSLHSLSMRYSRVSDHGVFLLSQELLTNSTLRCINLEWWVYHGLYACVNIHTAMILALRVRKHWHLTSYKLISSSP